MKVRGAVLLLACLTSACVVSEQTGRLQPPGNPKFHVDVELGEVAFNFDSTFNKAIVGARTVALGVLALFFLGGKGRSAVTTLIGVAILGSAAWLLVRDLPALTRYEVRAGQDGLALAIPPDGPRHIEWGELEEMRISGYEWIGAGRLSGERAGLRTAGRMADDGAASRERRGDRHRPGAAERRASQELLEGDRGPLRAGAGAPLLADSRSRSWAGLSVGATQRPPRHRPCSRQVVCPGMFGTSQHGPSAYPQSTRRRKTSVTYTRWLAGWNAAPTPTSVNSSSRRFSRCPGLIARALSRSHTRPATSWQPIDS